MARGILVVAAAALILPAGAGAKVGTLTQLPGKAGCVAQQNVPRTVKTACSVAHFPGREFSDAAVSPDGRNLYVLTITGGLAGFRIVHGRLHPLGRCFSPTGRAGCRLVPQLFHTGAIGVSHDGRSVYVGADNRGGAGGVVVFTRKRKTGELSRTGCVGEEGGGGCSSARGVFRAVSDIVPSSDGRSLYVASNSEDAIAAKSGALAVFAQPRSGKLTQLAGPMGCVNGTGADGCAQARGLGPTCCGIAASPDGRNVYISSSTGTFTPGTPGSQSAAFALAAFGRSTSSGGLTQLTGPAGCLSSDGSTGCAATPFGGDQPLNEAGLPIISPNGRDVYLAHSSTSPDAEGESCGGSDNFVAMLRRDPGTGALGPLQQDLSTCGAAVVMSSDGRSLYTSSGDFGSTVGTLARNRTTGLLTRAGCVGHQSRGCRQVRHVNAPDALAIDGNRYVYVLSNDPVEGSTIGVFRRSLR